MKSIRHIIYCFVALALLVAGYTTTARAQTTHYDELAKLPFPGAYPTEGSAKILKDELAFQRAVQTYLWALPAMNMYAMREGQRKAFDDGSNTLMIAKDRIDYRLEYTTGNPDVIYAFAWLDLKKDGPMVLEMPPKLQGLLDDMWHRPLTDIGAAGPDRNKGGKHLVVPANYKGTIPDDYYVVKSPTHGVFVFLRAFLVDGKTDQVGLDQALIIVSADHGMCEAPEYLQNLGFEVGRLTSATIVWGKPGPRNVRRRLNRYNDGGLL